MFTDIDERTYIHYWLFRKLNKYMYIIYMRKFYGFNKHQFWGYCVQRTNRIMPLIQRVKHTKSEMNFFYKEMDKNTQRYFQKQAEHVYIILCI